MYDVNGAQQLRTRLRREGDVRQLASVVGGVNATDDKLADVARGGWLLTSSSSIITNDHMHINHT
jgi:hypothetical protein